jgi:hypothetical protein
LDHDLGTVWGVWKWEGSGRLGHVGELAAYPCRGDPSRAGDVRLMVTVHFTEKEARLAREAIGALSRFLMREGVLVIGESAALIESTQQAVQRGLCDHETRSGFEALGVPEFGREAGVR